MRLPRTPFSRHRRAAGATRRPRRLSAPLAAALAASFVSGGLAVAATGDIMRVGERNAGSGETRIIGNSSSYATRQSNPRQGDGGAATYGCRAAPDNEPCLFSYNTENGLAFDFRSQGDQGGRFMVYPPSGDARDARPFTTNATGVATGLNADEVDGFDAADLRPRTARVAASGAASGTSARAARAAFSERSRRRTGTGSYVVAFDGSVRGCAYTATIASIDADGSVSVERSGERTLAVLTRDADGRPADRPFELVVNC